MYYLFSHNLNRGPFTEDQLRDMARQGTFTKTSLVWYQLAGKWQWVEARRISDFVDLFRTIENEALQAALIEAREVRQEVASGTRRRTTIIAVGGGKGGIGKTSLTAGLGLCLTALDQSVILVDCDLGGANLHTVIGLPEPQRTSVDFFIRQDASLEQLLTPTGLGSLRLISGRSGVLGLANLKYSQKLRFINQLKKLDADFVLLDLGAGTSYDVLDFFLSCDRRILITCPDLLSLENTFGFLKAAMYRGIARSCSGDKIVHRHLQQLTARAFQPTMFEFLEELRAESIESADAVWDRLAERPAGLILNMVMRRGEIKDVMELIADASRKLTVAVELLGQVAFDSWVLRSIRRQIPFVVARPKSKASRDMMKIAAEKLLQPGRVDDRNMQRAMIRRLKLYRTATPELHNRTESPALPQRSLSGGTDVPLVGSL